LARAIAPALARDAGANGAATAGAIDAAGRGTIGFAAALATAGELIAAGDDADAGGAAPGGALGSGYVLEIWVEAGWLCRAI
jgi:hypothetical protein